MGEFSIVYCEAENPSLCLFDQVSFVIPIKVHESGASEVTVDYRIELDR